MKKISNRNRERFYQSLRRPMSSALFILLNENLDRIFLDNCEKIIDTITDIIDMLPRPKKLGYESQNSFWSFIIQFIWSSKITSLLNFQNYFNLLVCLCVFIICKMIQPIQSMFGISKNYGNFFWKNMKSFGKIRRNIHHLYIFCCISSQSIFPYEQREKVL